MGRKNEKRSGGLGPHRHHYRQAQDGVQGDGEGPAGFGVLDRASAGAGLQLLPQLVNLPLRLGVDRKLILHGDGGQLLPHVPDLRPEVELVVCDCAGEAEEEGDERRDQLGAGGEDTSPQQQIHLVGSGQVLPVWNIKTTLKVCESLGTVLNI